MYKKHSKYLISVVFLFFTTYSCNKINQDIKKIENNPLFLRYSNVQIGASTEYKITQIIYKSIQNKIDTNVFFIKETYTNTFIDLSTQIAFKKKRYIKNNINDDWVLKDLWITKIIDNKLIQTEENLRLYKLNAPINISTTWDVNRSNYLEKNIYSYKNINQPLSINNLHFDSTLTVFNTQNNVRALTETNFFTEKYATGVGMIYKKVIKIKNKLNINTGRWEPLEGDDITYEIIKYSI